MVWAKEVTGVDLVEERLVELGFSRASVVETLDRLLLVMGERLRSAGTERIPGWLDDDPDQRASARRLTPAERLERAFAANAFAASLHGQARR